MSDITIHQPSAEFVKQANVSGMAAYDALCKKAETDYEGFWAEQARELLSWKTPKAKKYSKRKQVRTGKQLKRSEPACSKTSKTTYCWLIQDKQRTRKRRKLTPSEKHFPPHRGQSLNPTKENSRLKN